MSNGPSQPTTWDRYECEGSSDRFGNKSVQDDTHNSFENNDFLGQSPRADGSDSGALNLRHRRLVALGDVGGVNSIRSFTRSWQRAASFAEVIPQRPSFVFAPDQQPIGAHDAESFSPSCRSGDEEAGTASSVPIAGSAPRESLLRHHLEVSGTAIHDDGNTGATDPSETTALLGSPRWPDIPGSFRERERKVSDPELRRTFSTSSAAICRGSPGSIFAGPPQLATPDIVGSYSSWRDLGAISSSGGDGVDFGQDDALLSGTVVSMAQAGEMWRQQQTSGIVPDGETQPILVKEVEQEDGKFVLTVKGQSTLPQTIFNSINTLIGVGLLSLPMGIKYAGWLCGMGILLGAALVTAYTAKLLAKCMDLDPSLITFSDLAYISFGSKARIATSILFTLELLAACVALMIIFADSISLLFQGLLSLTQWKIIFALVLIPLHMLPLRYLSFTSAIGILCCFTNGFIKPDYPGSLIQPATTYLFPANWLTLPLSFGLLMSPWAGHSVFPNIYRDMRHPQKYPRALKITFSFTYLLDATAAVAGLLMFGDNVMDAFTSNIFLTAGYPRALTILLCGVIGIIPLTKLPLNARPIVATLEVLLGVHQHAVAESSSAMVGRHASFGVVTKITIRVATILIFLVISILFPAFDSIMAFMGSALSFTICVTLPLCFYLKLFRRVIAPLERICILTLLGLSISLSAVGTVFAFLPRSLLEQAS